MKVFRLACASQGKNMLFSSKLSRNMFAQALNDLFETLQ